MSSVYRTLCHPQGLLTTKYLSLRCQLLCQMPWDVLCGDCLHLVYKPYRRLLNPPMSFTMVEPFPSWKTNHWRPWTNHQNHFNGCSSSLMAFHRHALHKWKSPLQRTNIHMAAMFAFHLIFFQLHSVNSQAAFIWFTRHTCPITAPSWTP